MKAWGARWGLLLGLLFWVFVSVLGFGGGGRGGFGLGIYGFFAHLALGAVLGALIGRSLQRHMMSLATAQAEEAVENALADVRRELAARRSRATATEVETGLAVARASAPTAQGFEARAPEVQAAAARMARTNEPITTLEPTEPAPVEPVRVERVEQFEPTEPTEPTEPVPREPILQEPSPFDKALHAARDWLTGGNPIVRVGLVILFIGLTFLARYAASLGLFPLEMRLALVGIVGAAMLAVGFRKRELQPTFALPMQGAGIAVMFLTIFAAFRMGPLIPASAAFALMVLVTAGGCALALLQNSRALAFAAFAGAFATPVMLSTGQGNHVVLFGYYLVLNVAVLVLAAKRSWRELNLLAFVATFVVAGAWGVLKYQAQDYATSQAFLIAFALIFVATAVLYARNTPTRLGNAVDSTLVFGTPFAVAALQAGLVRQFEFGLAFSSLAAAALYLVLAAVLVRRGVAGYRLLVECFVALGVGFLTLAVPLALDARWTSTVWALEGAAVFWVGARQARWMPRAFGVVMLLVAAMVFVSTALETPRVQGFTLLNPLFMGALLVALPAWAVAWWSQKPLPHSGSRFAALYAPVESLASTPLFWVGFVFWCNAWMLELDRHTVSSIVGGAGDMGASIGTWVVRDSLVAPLRVLIVALSAVVLLRLAHRMPWRVAAWPSLLVLPYLLVALAKTVLGGGAGMRVLLWPHAVVWVAIVALHLWLLHRFEAWHRGSSAQVEPTVPTLALGLDMPMMLRWLHVGTVWAVVLWLAAVLSDVIVWSELRNTSWASVVVLTSSIVVLLALALWAGRGVDAATRTRLSWPLEPHAVAYAWHAALPIAVLVLVGALVMALVSSGRTHPLPYVPLLNPTELAVALSLAALGVWRRVVQRLVVDRDVQGSTDEPLHAMSLRVARAVAGREGAVALGVAGFVALNTVWLRIAHHFFDVPWTVSALFRSFTVQTGYAILWSLVALASMVWAKRHVHRNAWIVGAVLLGAVVLKLLVIDMSNSGGGERIVAFMAVGVLMLIVGYFVPLPPRRVDQDEPADGDVRKVGAELAP